MNKEINSSDYQNDWANNIKSVPIHIDNAKSGAQGYYCLGCGKEMQAVKYKNPKHQSYFRHHASNIDKEKTECVVASKVYRERLAEQILHRLKQIKVPTLLKYPPKGQEGNPMFLDEAKVITAKKVMSQLSFYENEYGEIKWGKNPKIDDRYLLIRPDITFFDEKDEPILFIEFVITHKINDEKKVKLSRIGIDTVQIIIPKLPENEIEKSLKSVRKIKWVYNGIEANTPYISTSEGDTERVFPIDEEQRKLLEESYACTAAKVSNLIRAIKRNLGSQSYQRSEQLFEQEISRIEKATKRAEKELERMEKGIEEELFEEFKGENTKITSEGARIDRDEIEFEREKADLEKRYFNKAIELRDEEKGIGNAIRECRSIGTTTGEIERSYKVEEATITEEFRLKTARIRESIEFHRKILKDHKEKERTISNNFGEFEKSEQGSFKTFKEQIEREIGDLERKIEGFGDYVKQEEEKLSGEFENIREQALKRIVQRDSKGSDELSKRINDVLEAGRISSNFNEKRQTYERYKKGLELARRGTKK